LFERKISEIEMEAHDVSPEDMERRRMLLDMSEEELRKRVMKRYHDQNKNKENIALEWEGYPGRWKQNFW